jgi:uncharacterized membrane protein
MTTQSGSEAQRQKASDMRLAVFVALLMALLGVAVVVLAYPRLNDLQLKVITVLVSLSSSFLAFTLHYYFHKDALHPRGRLLELVGFLALAALLLIFGGYVL